MGRTTKILDLFRRGAAAFGGAAGSIAGAFAKSMTPRPVKSAGEAAFARMTGAYQFGAAPSIWNGNSKIEQVQHYRAWVSRAIDTIEKLATKEPPVAVVVRDREERKGWEERRKAFAAGKGAAPEPRRWLNDTERLKALSAIRPHEEVEHLGEDHPLARLIRHPNEFDTGSDLWREFILFLELCGISYLWPVGFKNAPGVAELWVMPAHWVWPQSKGADRLVDYYEIYPYGPSGRNEPMIFDADELIPVRYKSPLSKVDGASPVQQAAEIIDVDESLRLQRFFGQKMGVNIGTIFKLDAGANPTDAQIERAESKIAAKFVGERGFRRPMVLAPGMDIIYPPGDVELAHIQSTDQMRDYVLGMWGLSKTVAGFTEGVNRATFEGAMAQAYYMVVNPRLSIIGETLSAHLCPRIDPKARIYWPDMTPADRAVQLQEWQARMQFTPYRPNEFIRWCHQEELPEGEQVVEPPGMAPAGLDAEIDAMGDDSLMEAARGGGAEGRANGAGMRSYAVNGNGHAKSVAQPSTHELLEKQATDFAAKVAELGRRESALAAATASASHQPTVQVHLPKSETLGLVEKRLKEMRAAHEEYRQSSELRIAELKAAADARVDGLQKGYEAEISRLVDAIRSLPAPQVTVEAPAVTVEVPAVNFSPTFSPTLEVQPAEVTVTLERRDRAIEFTTDAAGAVVGAVSRDVGE